MDTSSAYTTKNLNLGCVIYGTTITVYSSNTIAFTVTCAFNGVNPNPNSYVFSFN